MNDELMNRAAAPGVNTAASDAERIVAELTGVDLGTDPFVAAVRVTRMPTIIINPRLDDNPVVCANDAFCWLAAGGRQHLR